MKNIFLLFTTLSAGYIFSHAQSAEYKNGILTVDGDQVAKIVKTKEYMGLANTFEVFDMEDEKIIIAAWGGEFEQDPNNTLDFYYKLDFLTVNQAGIFTLSKLGTENALGKMLGKSGIFVDGKINGDKVKNFISSKGKTPAIRIDYTLVSRNKSWPIQLKEGGIIEQDGKQIGSFKDISVAGSGTDTYEFYLPSGVLLAKTSFMNGNNSQYAQLQTMKDNSTRDIQINTNETITAVVVAVDRNKWVLERIIKWMVANEYL